MTIHVERLQDEAIIVYRYPEKLESNQEIRDATVAEADLVLKMPDPVIWVIHDTRRLTIDFGRLVTALVTLTTEGPEGADDPRLRVAAISSSELVKLAAKAATQKQYGNWKVSIFETYEEALMHAREDLATERKNEIDNV
ncbi:MAG: hypothetical protein JXB30_12490 [Anaerolineae bacterium]|nr:hypothetical protein [Anaerolineae bacterium]